MKGTKESQQEAARTSAPGGVVGEPESVERIRDIIFGAQMRDYEERFESLERRLGEVIRELSQTLEQRIDKLNQLVLKQFGQLNRELQRESRERGEGHGQLESRLEETHSSLSQSIDARRVETEKALSQLQDLLSQQTSETADRLRRKLETLIRETKESLERLSSQKADRTRLASLLSEVARQLDETGRAPRPRAEARAPSRGKKGKKTRESDTV